MRGAGGLGREELRVLEEVLSEEVAVLANKSGKGVSLKVTIPRRFARVLGWGPGTRLRVVLDPVKRRAILEEALGLQKAGLRG